MDLKKNNLYMGDKFHEHHPMIMYLIKEKATGKVCNDSLISESFSFLPKMC